MVRAAHRLVRPRRFRPEGAYCFSRLFRMESPLSDWHKQASGNSEVRPTARILLLDLDGNTLLFCGRAEDGSRFWFTPGGEIEPGEKAEVAALRELFEETGITDARLEAEIWRRSRNGMFLGHMREFRERWFMARVQQFEPNTSGFNQLERDTIIESRWWSLAELRASPDRLVPSDLPDRLQTLLRDGPPERPIDLSKPENLDETDTSGSAVPHFS
jgi:8-oxo-dGTP pyrophosphatase MutT (NUDIX family)